MRRQRSRLNLSIAVVAACGLGVGSFVGGAEAAAEARGELRLVYESPPDVCPSEPQFRAWVHERAPKDHLKAPVSAHATGTSNSHPEIQVRIAARGDDFESTLAVGHHTRRIHGASCVEVARATAFAVALLIEEGMAATPIALPPPAVHSLQPAASPWSRQMFGGAIVEARGVPGPSPVAAYSLFGELRWWRDRRAASARLIGVMSPGAWSEVDDDKRARWSLAALRGEVCPWGHQRIRWKIDLPCLGVEGGAVRSEGSNVEFPATGVQSWAALSAGLRFAAAPLPSAPWLFLELDGASLIPLTRHRYVFDPTREEAHRVAALSWRGGLAVAVRFF